MDSSFLIYLGDIIKPICILAVLPIVIVWLFLRHKKNETEKRTEIVMAAIEKNGEINVEEFINSLSKPRKSAREVLLLRLHWEILFGSVFTIFGAVIAIVLIVLAICTGDLKDDIIALGCCCGIPTFAIGIGLLAAYKFGMKTLKELEN